MIFKRKLRFILFGNKGTGKTTLARLLTGLPFLQGIEPTKENNKFNGVIKLESSRNSSFFTLERFRKYKLSVIDVPGSFEDRRHWRDAFKKSKKPYALCVVVEPFQSIPETQSVFEELYNRYLESISNDLEKADNIASHSSLLILIVFNDISKGEFDEHQYYESVIKETVSIIRQKIPLLLVDYVRINLQDTPKNYYDLNAILERIKRFYYDQKY